MMFASGFEEETNGAQKDLDAVGTSLVIPGGFMQRIIHQLLGQRNGSHGANDHASDLTI